MKDDIALQFPRCFEIRKYHSNVIRLLLFTHLIGILTALEVMGSQWSLTAGIWYMTATKAFTVIKMTAEFFLISKIKFLFNLARLYTIQLNWLICITKFVHIATKFMLHDADQIWLPSNSMCYLTIMKLYNFLKKKKKLIACDCCFISDVIMVDTCVNKPSFIFILATFSI